MEPSSGIIQGTDGNYYGSTPLGGTNSGNGYGTVFRLSTTGVFTNLHSFSGKKDGAYPSGLVQGANGYFYGTTGAGGTTNYNPYGQDYGYGTVFKLDTNGVLTTLYTFTNGADGSSPGGLLLGNDGNFYGTTTEGSVIWGTSYGTLFKVSTSGKLTTLFSFTTTGFGGSALTFDSEDNLYGVSAGNATCYNMGFLFKIKTNGILLWQDYFVGLGCYPQAGLVLGSDGYFYGTTSKGGIGYSENNCPFLTGYGTYFKVATNGTLTTLFLFNNTNGPYSPWCSLALGTDGNFYGITEQGGANNKGTVFQIIGTNVNTLVSFNGVNGWSPCGSLVQGSDGNFYGTTISGGAYSHGTIFRLTVPMPAVFQTITKIGSKLNLTWNAVAGQTYQLQWITNLVRTNWINLGTTNIATNAIISASDTNASDRQRFYRVMVPP
jgi:uncharacterized repeat protein (TIGR03803 family)